MSTAMKSDTRSPASEDCSEISVWTPEDGLHDMLLIEIRTPDEVFAELAGENEADVFDPTPRYSFLSFESMHRALAPNRMAIIRTLTGSGPLSIREVARRVGRDFKGVHTDVTSLVSKGLLYKTADGAVIFPYARIHFEFEVGGAEQPAA
jgi:predicted transcriptional regulator